MISERLSIGEDDGKGEREKAEYIRRYVDNVHKWWG